MDPLLKERRVLGMQTCARGVFPRVVKLLFPGTSLAVQWLRLCTSNARAEGSIHGQGPKIPHAAQPAKKLKKKFFF